MIFWISNRKENSQFTKRAYDMQTPVFDLSKPRSSTAFHKAVYDLECLLAKHRFENAERQAALASGLDVTRQRRGQMDCLREANPVGNTGITSSTDNGLSNG